jgi:hypothetical protein
MIVVVIKSDNSLDVRTQNMCIYKDTVCIMPVTAAERFKACTVFARSETGIVGSNPTHGMDVWYVCMRVLACIILYLCTGRGLATS